MYYTDFLPSLNLTAEKYLKHAQQEVEYCITCQPYDGGSYIWVLGEKTTLEDIFEDIKCPEKYRDDISAYIVCPNCGSHGFERYDTVGKQDRYDAAVEQHLKQANQKYGSQVKELQQYLELYPSLALKTRLGRKLFKEITCGTTATTPIFGTWYRARTVNGQVFSSDDMGAAPTGKADSGRYHYAGQSVLYLADSDTTAVHEVLADPNRKAGLVWIQQFEIGRIENLLDLRSDWDLLGPSTNTALVAALSSKLFEQKVEDRSNKWKPQYFVTQFIADCARLAGYKGIRYNSTRSFGDNVVLFVWDASQINPTQRPQVYIHEPRPDFSPDRILEPEDYF
jgi:hypothetical protein